MLLLFDHISNHTYDYYFFLALNGLDGPYAHNCSFCNIIIQYVSEAANVFRHPGRKCTGRMIL